MTPWRILPPAPPPTRELCEIHFVKRGHYYRFRCPKGQELELLYILFESALDPELNLDLHDVRRIAGALGHKPVSNETGRP